MREKKMADRLLVGTRKGLFEIARRNGTWDVAAAHFLGDPVSAVLATKEAADRDTTVITSR